jgi:hypothetical protein
MQDENRIYLSDSLKDILDLEETEKKIEVKNNINFVSIQTQNSLNKIFTIPIQYEEKKKSIKLKLLIQNNHFNQLISENILDISFLFNLNILKYFSCENYSIYKKIKKLNENNYILILKLKEIKDE